MLDNAKACEWWLRIAPLSPIHSGANRHGSKLQAGYVCNIFQEHWFGHGPPVLPAPLDWPLQTPDLSQFPFGLPKGDCCTVAYQLLKTLNNQWDWAIKLVNPQMLQKTSHRTRCRILCHENDVAHLRFVSYVVKCVISILQFYGE